MSTDRVECRSDHAYIGYPIAFFWQDKRLEVTKIISENHNPAGYSFTVLSEEYGCFKLLYDVDTDHWSVYRQGA
jgi:hypothetical protein